MSRDDTIKALLAVLAPQETQRGISLRGLAEPFPVDAISWRVGTTTKDKNKGMALAYIDARDVMDRLDHVCGPDWQDKYEAMPDGSYCCSIGIKIDGEWRWRSDGALMLTDSEKNDAKEMAQKGSYSDAFKRAAVKWGIGRYLYNLDSPWVKIEPRGNSYVIADEGRATLRNVLLKQARAAARVSQQIAGDVEPDTQSESLPAPLPQQQEPAGASERIATVAGAGTQPKEAPTEQTERITPTAKPAAASVPAAPSRIAAAIPEVAPSPPSLPRTEVPKPRSGETAAKLCGWLDKQKKRLARNPGDLEILRNALEEWKLDARGMWGDMMGADQRRVKKERDELSVLLGIDPETGEILREAAE